MNAFDVTAPHEAFTPMSDSYVPGTPAAFFGHASGVSLKGIDAWFGRAHAIREVNLDIPAGEFVALVGPSGAGKTTLLRIIAGLERSYTGALAIGARDVSRVSARDRNIGFVFQNYALFGHMSVAENIAFGLRVRPRARRPDRHAIAATVARLLELVQIGELGQRRPHQLSGGQRQRVALARALAIEPAVLLLDEPFGALDPLVRKEIRVWLRSLHDRLGLTSILVTHDQAEAIEVADRIVVLRDGAIAGIGSPAELEDRPASDFVHRFMGERVAFAGSLHDGQVTLDDAPGRTLAPAASVAAALGGRVIVSARPYEIAVLRCGSGLLAGTVLRGHRAGAHHRYEIALDARPREAAPIDVLVACNAQPFHAGEPVTLDLTRPHFFAAP